MAGPFNTVITIDGQTYSQSGASPPTVLQNPGQRIVYQRGASTSSPYIPGTKYRQPKIWSMNAAIGDIYAKGSFTYNHAGKNGPLTRIHGILTNFSRRAMSYGTVSAKQIRNTELAALLNINQGRVELGASIMERAETANMFQETCGRIRDGFQAFRRARNPSSLFRGLGKAYAGDSSSGKRITQDWLAWQYGWKPLVGDIQKAVQKLNERDNALPNNRTMIVSRATTNYREKFSADPFGSSVIWSWTEQDESRCQVGFIYELDDSEDFHRNLNDWGVYNLLDVAWETLPLSFLTDWALPIGDYIKALTATAGYSLVAGWRTEFVTRTCVNRYTRGSDQYPIYNPAVAASCSWQTKAMRRNVYTSFPVPDFKVLLDLKETPTAQVIATRVANGLSLLAQTFD